MFGWWLASRERDEMFSLVGVGCGVFGCEAASSRPKKAGKSDKKLASKTRAAAMAPEVSALGGRQVKDAPLKDDSKSGMMPSLREKPPYVFDMVKASVKNNFLFRHRRTMSV